MTAASSELEQRERGLDDRPALGARGALIGLVIAAGVIDFLICPLVRACEGIGMAAFLFIGPLVFALVLGQIGAMALWLVWGEGRFLHRLITHWALAAGLGAAFWLGMTAVWRDPLSSANLADLFRPAAMVACALPAISLAAQLPLWPLRTYFGWRVERTDSEAAAVSPPLSLQDMFCGTAIVGVTLGLVRMMASLFPGEFIEPAFIWLQLAMPAIAALGMTLFIGIPAVICVLRTRSLATGIGSLCGYLLLALLLLLGIPSLFSGGGPAAATVIMMVLGVFSLAATLATPLLVLRSCGYRLSRPRDRRSPI